jgi:hypothetical protein
MNTGALSSTGTAPRPRRSCRRPAQRLPRVASSDDIYASNRLVDLYLAWPGHETKGLRELRRLIDTYPENDVAASARAGLVNLKGQLGIAE